MYDPILDDYINPPTSIPLKSHRSLTTNFPAEIIIIEDNFLFIPRWKYISKTRIELRKQSDSTFKHLGHFIKRTS